MVVQLDPFTVPLHGSVQLPGSKSISNRALIIRALSGESFPIAGLAEAKDTQTMIRLLDQFPEVMDVGPAGTTFRFLTAYLSLQPGVQVLTGSDRMKQRPIGLLVEALRKLGAKIDYLEKEGYPPLRIQGFDPAFQEEKELSIPASTSSQFISALLLIAPVLPLGLHLQLEGEIVSRPYIQMTLNLMTYFGAPYQWEGDVIQVPSSGYLPKSFEVESDWSAASYYYTLAALAPEADLRISRFQSKSVQGDAVMASYMTRFGIQSSFEGNELRIFKPANTPLPESFTYNFLECPDTAQSVAVICAGLGVPARLEGLRTLRVKETDRIQALITELAKVGVEAWAEGDEVLHISGKAQLADNPSFTTYEDHRMAMAFAPLACRGKLQIEDPAVVDKSYPSFWKDLKSLGFTMEGA